MEQILQSDILRTDAYLHAFPTEYMKVDVVFLNRSVVWRDMNVSPPNTYGWYPKLICGHGDYALTESMMNRYNVGTWWGTNRQTPRMKGLPLGITNDTDESPVHRIYGNIPCMIEALQMPKTHTNICYMNFSVQTYPQERMIVRELFQSKSWVTIGAQVDSLDGRRRYLQEIRQHSFVLCPRGAGVDTHRLWETLYMGSIPIVIRDIAHDGWLDLPILFIDSWSDVTEEFLRQESVRFANTNWNLEKLKASYWIDRIQTT